MSRQEMEVYTLPTRLKDDYSKLKKLHLDCIKRHPVFARGSLMLERGTWSPKVRGSIPVRSTKRN